MRSVNPVRCWRKKGQKGSETMELVLFGWLFLIPTFLWTFVNGVNLIRMNTANEVTRDLGDQYIHGVDYTTYEAQAVAQKLAGGFGLQIGSSFTGNIPNNDANGGNAYVVVAEIMYIGNGSCSSLPNGTTCTNQNKYVFLQYIDFGNKTLQINGTQVASALGTTAASINSNGMVQNYLTDPNAVASTVGSYFQTQLTDGQVAYVAETFFASPDLNFSAYPAGGIHSLDFF
jgi:hypothetical protein